MPRTENQGGFINHKFWLELHHFHDVFKNSFKFGEDDLSTKNRHRRQTDVRSIFSFSRSYETSRKHGSNHSTVGPCYNICLAYTREVKNEFFFVFRALEKVAFKLSMTDDREAKDGRWQKGDDRQTNRQTEIGGLFFHSLGIMKRQENMKVTVGRMRPITIFS